MKATWKPIEQYHIVTDDFGNKFAVTIFEYTPERIEGRFLHEIDHETRKIWKVASMKATQYANGTIGYDTHPLWKSLESLMDNLFYNKVIDTNLGSFIVTHQPFFAKPSGGIDPQVKGWTEFIIRESGV